MGGSSITKQLHLSNIKSRALKKSRSPRGGVKERLLAESMKLFAEKGYEGVAVDKIVEAAGVNKRMIYHYFGSKEGVYNAVLEQAFEGLRASEEKFFLPANKPVHCREAMSELVGMYFLFLKSHPEFVRLLLWENLQQGTHMECTGAQVSKSPMLAHLAHLLAEGESDGSFRAGLDSRQVLVSLIGLCLIYFSNRHTLSRTVGLNLFDPRVLKDAIKTTSALLLDGICRHQPLG
jgi:AcrR family transcriptional regulator